MIRRATWFCSGAIAALAGAGYVRRKWKRSAQNYAPTRVAKRVGARVKYAVREGRRVMHEREAELKS